MKVLVIMEIATPVSQSELEALLIEGLESGDAIPVTPEFWKDLWKRVDSRRNSGQVASVDFKLRTKSTMTKKTSSAPPECIAAYDRLITSFPNIERKGATMPYTSINDHMTSYLNSDGLMALKLPPAEREEFLAKYETKLFEAYGIVQKEFVTVPPALLSNTDELKPHFAMSVEWVQSLKPKAKNRKGK